MPKLKVSIDIDAAPDHVFAAAEPVKMPEWTIHIKEVTVTSGDGKSAGTTDRTIIQATPRQNKLESTWTDYKQGETFTRRFTGYLEGVEQMTFTPQDGGTRVEWRYDYKPPFGVIGKIGAALVMGRVMQNNLETSLENLKRELEI